MMGMKASRRSLGEKREENKYGIWMRTASGEGTHCIASDSLGTEMLQRHRLR
jgi:hypothetical protein